MQIRIHSFNRSGVRGTTPEGLNMPFSPIVDKYREGKVKKNPNQGVKERLNPGAYNQSWFAYANNGLPFA